VGVDNTLWQGKVADESVSDDDTEALKALNQKIHDDERVEMVLLPIGDGLTLCLKR
jgi:caffeoyl-CoA O-methyltransferase